MTSPPPASARKSETRLTGRTRYRIGLLGRLVVEVEEWWWGMPAFSRQVGWSRRWRDADPLDLRWLGVPAIREGYQVGESANEEGVSR